MRKVFLAIAWGFVATAIAFWLNKLLLRVEFPNLWMGIVAVVSMEEVAKFVAIRNSRPYSLVVPLVFLVGESAVQVYSPFYSDPFTAWLFAVLLGLVALKQILFYVPVYLSGYRLYSLPVAIGLHAVWNWYVEKPVGDDLISLAIVCLAVILLPVVALYRYQRE